MDLLERGDEINKATRALMHALKTRKDLDSHMRDRITLLIERAKKITNRTSEQAIQDLIRESADLNDLFTAYNSRHRSIQRGATISKMENGHTARDVEPNSLDSQFENEFRRISSEAQRVARELNSAPSDQTGLLNSKLLDLANEQDQLILSRYPISVGELIDHPDFAQAVREGYERMNADGRLRFSTMLVGDTVNLARDGMRDAGNPSTNPYSNLNPLSSKRQLYQVLLNQGVIQRAFNDTRRKILDGRIYNVRSRIPIANQTTPPVQEVPTEVHPKVAPAPEPIAVVPNPPTMPQGPGMQYPGQSGPTTITGHPGAPTYITNFNNYAGGPPGVSNTPTSGPGHAPAALQAPAQGHDKPHGHETHAPVTNEAERQKLRNEYERLEKEQNDVIAQGLHLEDKDGAKGRELFKKMQTLKAEQRKVCLTLFGPNFDAMVQAEREKMAKAGPAHPEAPHGHEVQHAQPTAAEAQRGIEGVRNTAASNYAAFVAGKQGLPATEVQRWMSAPKRWARALVDGVFRGAFVSAAGMWGTGLTSMLTTYSTASVFGLALPFTISAPVVLAGVGGALAWAGARRILGMRQTDRAVDAGWQANKLRRIMSRHERRGNNPDIERKYARINKWWKKAIRAQNLIPSLLGGVIGGVVMYDIHTGGNLRRAAGEYGRGLYNEGMPGLRRRGSGMLQWITQTWNNFWRTGEQITPACMPQDHMDILRIWREHGGQRYSWTDAIYEDPALRDPGLRLDFPNSHVTPTPQPPAQLPQQPQVPQAPFADPVPPAPPSEPPLPAQPPPPMQPPALQPPPDVLSPAPLQLQFASWRGFPENLMVQNPSGGFEALVQSIPGIDVSQLNFGSGNPSNATDIFRRVMYETPGAWKRFFDEYVPGSGSDAFEYAARRLPTGRVLDYSVLTENFGSSSSIIDRMIARAEALGRGGEATVEALRSLRDALTQGRNPSLLVPIGRQI